MTKTPTTDTVRLTRRGFAGVPLPGWDVRSADGNVIGWVVPNGRRWHAYVSVANSPVGREVGWGLFRTRTEAVAEVEINRET